MKLLYQAVGWKYKGYFTKEVVNWDDHERNESYREDKRGKNVKKLLQAKMITLTEDYMEWNNS